MNTIHTKGFFAPRVSADTADFWRGCAEHRLLIQRCKSCGKLRWPAARFCDNCLGEDTELCELSGRGTVYSWEVFHKPFHPSLEDQTPYIVAQIDLEEGVRILSNLEGCDPSEVRCGSAVELVWRDCADYTSPVFVLKKAE